MESVFVVSEEVILLLGLYRWLVFTVAKTITGDTNKRSLGKDIHFIEGIESGLADENKEFRGNSQKGACSGLKYGSMEVWEYKRLAVFARRSAAKAGCPACAGAVA